MCVSLSYTHIPVFPTCLIALVVWRRPKGTTTMPLFMACDCHTCVYVWFALAWLRPPSANPCRVCILGVCVCATSVLPLCTSPVDRLPTPSLREGERRGRKEQHTANAYRMG